MWGALFFRYERDLLRLARKVVEMIDKVSLRVDTHTEWMHARMAVCEMTAFIEQIARQIKAEELPQGQAVAEFPHQSTDMARKDAA
jgi:hypothetical protein